MEGQGKKAKQKAIKNEMNDHIDKVLFIQMREDAEMFTDKGIQEGKAVCYMEQAPHVTDFEQLQELDFNGYKMVKTVQNVCPYNKNIQIIDLKLDVYGPQEDIYYSTLPSLIKNIRRGNTILKVTDPNNQNVSYSIARKGLMKFFDLRLDFVSSQERRRAIKDVYHHQEKNHILAPALKAIQEGHQVEVLKTLKANGENVQISYHQETESWIISSKNVGLMAQSKIHLNSYRNCEMADRYRFAIEMAEVWFAKLETYDGEKCKNLKKKMAGKTLVGEYIGSQDHQHLVKYSRVSLIFYAVVDNNSDKSCWPCSQSWAFFKHFDLDMVHINSLGVFDNFNNLCDSLEVTFKNVAKSSIAQDEEGNVIYIIKKDSKTQKEEVLSLAKLKTLEYRLFRKMREKLRGSYKDGVAQVDQAHIKSKVAAFTKESKTFLMDGQNELPQPLDYYIMLFENAFVFLNQNIGQIKVLQEEFVTFSENLLKFIKQQNNSDTNINEFFVSNILDVQKDIKYGKGVEMETKLDELVPMLSLQNPEEEEKKISQPVEEQKVSTSEIKKVIEQISLKDAKIKGKKVIFIIPFTMPGSGKSYHWKIMKQILEDHNNSNWSFGFVSSDQIRGSVTQKLIQQNPNWPKDKAFEKAGKPANNEYKAQQIELIKACGELKEGQVKIIFLDKNHPPNGGIASTVAVIDQFMPKGIQYTKLHLIPDRKKPLIRDFPFSYELMAQSFYNASKRDEHETIDNTDIPKVFAIQIMFMKMSRKSQYNDWFINQQKLHGFWKVPLNNENIEVSEDFKTALDQVTQVRAKGLIDADNHFLQELIKQVQINEAKFGIRNSEDQMIRAITQNLVDAINTPEIWSDFAQGGQNEIMNQMMGNQGGKMPLYLAVDAQSDNEWKSQVTKIFSQTLKIVEEELGVQNDYISDLKKLCNSFEKQKGMGQWKLPASYHVTQLFIGGNPKKADNPIYNNYEDGKQVPFEIRGVLYVPGRILTGIAFLKADIENQFPHMTLMISQKYNAVISNEVLKKTCNQGQAFFDGYKQLQSNEQSQQCIYHSDTINIEFKRNQVETTEVYFIGFDKSQYIKFNGAQKSHYN